MTRGRQLSAGAAVAIAGGATLAVYLYWQQIAAAALLFGAGRLCWHRLRTGLGVKARPKSSWNSLARTAILGFGAWQMRWLKPTSKAARKIIEENPEPDGEDIPYA